MDGMKYTVKLLRVGFIVAIVLLNAESRGDYPTARTHMGKGLSRYSFLSLYCFS